MNIRILLPCLGLLALLVGAPAASAKTLEEVEKEIGEKYSKLKSLEQKMKFTHEMKTEGFEMKSKGETLFEYKRSGDKAYKYRNEMKTKSEQKIQGEEKKEDSEILTIHDGEYLYSYMVSGDQKRATKAKIDPKLHTDPFDQKTLFESHREHFKMKLLPDEEVDGKSTYVIETTPKDAENNPVAGKTLTYYDKKTGISIKSVSFDKDGKKTGEYVTTDVKIDGNISDDRFVFKAPPGVEVVEEKPYQAPTEEKSDEETAEKDDDTDDEKAEEEDKSDDEAEKKDEEKEEEKKKEEKGLKGLFKKIG